MTITFMGYERPDGTAGARNHLAVIPTVACANGVVAAICRAVPGAVPFFHGHGCGRAGRDLERHFRGLTGLATHPNLGAVLLVGLGCEVIKPEFLSPAVSATGKPVETVVIQNEGGTGSAAAHGAELAAALLRGIADQQRSPVPLSRLVLGLKCGGSDAFSGVTANPAVGLVADRVVDEGGTVVLTESTEMIGTERILARRASDPAVAERIVDMVEAAERRTHEVLGPLASLVIAPGNMDGGVSSIQEKSLGCIAKGGSTPINQVVDYAERPTASGLTLMDAPGYDMESLSGVAAAGAQAIIFTTGRGTPVGFPAVPVIKVASNTPLFESMPDDMDIDAGRVLSGGTLADVAQDIQESLLRVLDGERTRAEANGQEGIVCLYTTSAAF